MRRLGPAGRGDHGDGSGDGYGDDSGDDYGDDYGAREVGEPILASGADEAWSLVRQSVAWHGHAVVYADWRDWLPRVLEDAELRPMLGSRDWQRLRGLPDPESRSRFAVSRLLMRCTAGAALQAPPGSIDLAYKPGGRPYLRGCDQIDVSLSHTGELIVVGLNRRGRIGVDTELASRRIRYASVERQLCTPDERALLGGLPEAERERELLRVWTLKEAYTKALGQGMRMGFNQFGFSRGGESLLTPDGRPASRGEWSFATFEVLGTYLLSVACHDVGLDGAGDLAVGTMLDAAFVHEIVGLLGEK
ncbi:4'-phosphopantetheinyl transferase family protein [Streptomyces sp. NRRL F-5126]|uniref:4'-phosphopantetheinyl transferase family protein n=1 Tax=Streptomyces sp. NRRL F-5126 TaxID=1463857 RepID=UPI00099CD30C|nr:4'-phosphopantetheinyl transferase superfamily protein [Streptomyces sp. NRRL F-5126]